MDSSSQRRTVCSPTLLVGLLGTWCDRRGPHYRRIADALTEVIDRGEIPLGTRLPSERSLARSLSVSRTTTVTAYQWLRDKGLLESRQGSGTWVSATYGAGRHITSMHGPEAPRLWGRLFEEPTGAIDLSLAVIHDTDALSEDVLSLTTQDVARAAPIHGYVPFGVQALRQRIADGLSDGGLPTTEHQVLVTTGAQQAIRLIAELLVRPGDPVALETPGYPGALDAFTRVGARFIPLPMDDCGVRVEALASVLQHRLPRLAFLMPTFQNPTGASLPEGRRREVASLADHSGIPVVEDLSLAPLSFGAEPPLPIASFAGAGSVVSVGSLSKVFWGGLRVGWVRADEGLIARLGRLKSTADLSSSVLPQLVALRLLDNLDSLIRLRREQLRDRRDVMLHFLRTRLPDWEVSAPEGGMVLWPRLPAGSSDELAQVALRHGVVILPGSAFSHLGEHRDRIRLSFSCPAEVLCAGLERLETTWATYRWGGVPATTGMGRHQK